MGLDEKIELTTTLALEAIHDAAPGLLTMTQVAEKVASYTDVAVSTGRNRLRAAVEAGKLLELTPWSRTFSIELPGAKAAGVGPFYIAVEWTGTGRSHRHVVTTDDNKPRPSSYGPGRTTYLVDPDQVREYVQQLVDWKKAKQEADREARNAEKKLQRTEITRRFPGLQRHLRIFRLLSKSHTPGRENRGFAMVDTKAYLDTRDAQRGEEAATEERDTNVTINVYGDENVAILRAILEAGLSAYIAEQPLMVCKHCDRRILHTKDDHDDFWWHVETGKGMCDKDSTTSAEPVKED